MKTSNNQICKPYKRHKIIIICVIAIFCGSNLFAKKWYNKTAKLKGKIILLYYKNDRGFQHDNVPNSIAAFLELSKIHGFSIDTSANPNVFREENIKKYDAIVFSNTCGSVFDTEGQKNAFKNFVQKGGGFLGIHAAGDTEAEWDWYIKLVGGSFYMHPKFQKFPVHVVDKNHPSTQGIPSIWTVKDELYLMKKLTPDMRVLMVSDFSSPEFERSENMPDTFGDFYPCVWCNTFDGGRQWFTALGHNKEDWKNELYVKHIIGGLKWILAK